LSITVYRLPIKENKRPFSVSIRSKQTETCRLQQKNGSCRFSISSVFRLRNSINVEAWRHGEIKRKTEAHATICSLRKRKFVVCPFVDEETTVIRLQTV
jgi:hypothetical protein